MTTYTVDFNGYAVLARVSGDSADVEPTVELLGCTLNDKAVDVSTLNQEDLLITVLYHHDMMQYENSDVCPEPYVDVF